ncbi:MAG: hypothetical protein LBU32_06265 [Clostridiales bacterium]|nr:hypothetical protein [Clostridiales bacterium]
MENALSEPAFNVNMLLFEAKSLLDLKSRLDDFLAYVCSKGDRAKKRRLCLKLVEIAWQCCIPLHFDLSGKYSFVPPSFAPIFF